MLQKTTIILLLIFIFAPIISFANGGDQRVVEGKYLINLSRAPFTPRIGVKTSFLASFVDIQKNKLISEDLIVRVRISKLGDAPKGKFIFEQDDIAVKGGVLDFPYTFSEAVLHEIFFDFALASNPEEIYEVPDFLLDVQKAGAAVEPWRLGLVGAFLGIAIGFLAGWLGRRMVTTAP